MKATRSLKHYLITLIILSLLFCTACQQNEETDLWQVYNKHFIQAKYIDLTYAFSPDIPVWPGFGNAKFEPAISGKAIPGYVAVGDTFTIKQHGFIATAYHLPTDQYGTQLDPPAHWNPRGATISDIPPTYAIRPLVVIDVHEKVLENEGYHCQIDDIREWERNYGQIPPGAVVMIRSDWHKKWEEVDRYNKKPFPGISIEALKFLHNERAILFHGHEPLDTDTTATLEGEYWLLNNNFCQAEGVTNLDKVPEKGALITIGFARPEGGTGGFARYIAICPPDWPIGNSIIDNPGAPLKSHNTELIRDASGVLKPE